MQKYSENELQACIELTSEFSKYLGTVQSRQQSARQSNRSGMSTKRCNSLHLATLTEALILSQAAWAKGLPR